MTELDITKRFSVQIHNAAIQVQGLALAITQLPLDSGDDSTDLATEAICESIQSAASEIDTLRHQREKEVAEFISSAAFKALSNNRA